MKAAIVNPYLDTLGGGERYTLSFAKVLLEKGYQVDVEWKNKTIINILEKRFGIDLEGINVVQDTLRGDGYDVCFWVSDGSIPLLRARKNFLHFQVPFHGVNGKSLFNKMKLYRINAVVVNSQFTKDIIDEEYGFDSMVIYPPVDVKKIRPKRKEDIILFVGRFSRLKQSKGQDVLISAFKKLYDRGLKDWKLVLAGGVEVGVGDYLNQLKNDAENYPVEFLESPSFSEIKDLFGKARIFWSAAGYGIDQKKEPKKVEHFGITVVEAMSAGDIVFAYDAGGHKEIILDGKNGFLWKTKSELIRKTKKTIEDKGLVGKISRGAKKDSKSYGYEKFEAKIHKLL